MKTFQLDKKTAKAIHHFGSNFNMSKILEYDGDVHIAFMRLENGGTVGFHNAVARQLFLIVQGSGWFCGDKEEVYLYAGQAAYWEKGEGHGVRTEEGMTAIVVESDGLDPDEIMAEQREDI